jgi:hypothetical protein
MTHPKSHLAPDGELLGGGVKVMNVDRCTIYDGASGCPAAFYWPVHNLRDRAMMGDKK